MTSEYVPGKHMDGSPDTAFGYKTDLQQQTHQGAQLSPKIVNGGGGGLGVKLHAFSS
jgi:hypothetical protein